MTSAPDHHNASTPRQGTDAPVSYPTNQVLGVVDTAAQVSAVRTSLTASGFLDPDLALPVTRPWNFFADYEVELSDSEAERIGLSDPSDADVYVTVRAGGAAHDFTANLRAPIGREDLRPDVIDVDPKTDGLDAMLAKSVASLRKGKRAA